MENKILIAYYSWGGNTRKIAETIAEVSGGTLFEIIPQTPYTDDYNAVVEQGKREINEGFLPPLKESVANMDSYDIILVGSPNWWSTLAPPLATFLSEHDFSGKTVVPFCTHGGGGRARVLSDIEKKVNAATFLEGFDVYNAGTPRTKNDIADWLKNIGITE